MITAINVIKYDFYENNAKENLQLFSSQEIKIKVISANMRKRKCAATNSLQSPQVFIYRLTH